MKSHEGISEDPFGQGEYYYSESARELVRIDQMPLPYCLHAMLKMERQYPEFRGSIMQAAFIDRLMPRTQQVQEMLEKNGSCSTWCLDYSSRARARSMFYRVGKKIGHKVTTSRKKAPKGCFVEAVVKTQMSVRSRPVKNTVR